MEDRNLDLVIGVERAEWETLGRRAAELGPEAAGFDWNEQEPDEIRVFLRAEDAPNLWRGHVAGGDVYGAGPRLVARFRFNDGRPFADLDVELAPVEPVVPQERVEAMRVELEHWVRNKWQELLRASGAHYDRDFSGPEAA